MADLLTHYVSARLPGGFVKDPATRTTLILGVFLPDLVGKGLYWAPGAPDDLNVPTHSALGMLFMAWALAMLFAPGFRFRAFASMYIGCLLHVAIDLFKDNLGMGSARLLHPFSLDGFELGLYYNENIVWLVPGNAVILLFMRYAAKKARAMGIEWR